MRVKLKTWRPRRAIHFAVVDYRRQQEQRHIRLSQTVAKKDFHAVAALPPCVSSVQLLEGCESYLLGLYDDDSYFDNEPFIVN